MDIEEYSKYVQFYTEENISSLLNKFLNTFAWKSYLDLGCGDGSLLYTLNKKRVFDNKIVYAVDLSENRINLVKKINGNFKCFVGDACNIRAIKDNSIDFLVSSQVIEHVPNDESMVKEMARVLNKKNNIVYMSTVFKKWYGWYFYRCNKKWTLDPTHIREYTSDNQLFDVLKKNGFDVVESKKTIFWFPVIHFIFKRIGIRKNNVFNNRFLKFLTKIKIPVLGYRNWEIVFKKK
jgi:ubiquinone/menaquinone biosynthesis C-methylase UbiE